jgi:hypothetical protein
VVPGRYQGGVFPSGPGYLSVILAEQDFAADTTLDLVVPTAVLVTGSLQLSDGSPVQGQLSMCLTGTYTCYTGASDADGHYQVGVTAGTYDVTVQFGNSSGVPIAHGLLVAGPTQKDFVIQIVTVSGHVYDDNHTPLAQALVSFSSFVSGSMLIFNAYSAADGSYAVKVVPGRYQGGVYPWNTQVDLPYSMPEQDLDHDTTLDFELVRVTP